MEAKTTLTYQSSGVDIEAGAQLVEKIKPIAKKTRRPGVLDNLGGFGGLFELPLEKYKHPVLVSGTDGVGTKLKLAIKMNNHATIGVDLVAMCVNDIVVLGAEPLFFLDYYATSQLDVDVASNVVSGIGLGCEQAGAALIGGETAEMPGLYQPDDYDLAGFCVGIVEKEDLIRAENVKEHDIVIGLGSSGPHSNGYSLIRKILDHKKTDLKETLGEASIGELLLAPTTIYVKPLLDLYKKVKVKAVAHITGGGLLENIPRVLPNHLQAVLDNNAWETPAIFTWLQQQGNIEANEMFRTFNCGIGMTLIVCPNDVQATLKCMAQFNVPAWVMGTIQSKKEKAESVILND